MIKTRIIKSNLHLLLIMASLFLLSCSEKKEKVFSSNFEKHKDKIRVYNREIASYYSQKVFNWGIKNLDKSLILELCYGGTYNPLYDATIWTPLLGDAAEFEAWTDAKHPNPTLTTGITKMYKMEKDGNEQAIVIFKTDYEWVKFYEEYLKVEEDLKKPSPCGEEFRNVLRRTSRYFSSCPTGIAIFEKDLNNIWVLAHFNRNIGSPGCGSFEPIDSVFQIGTDKVYVGYEDKIKNFTVDSTVIGDDYRNVSYSRKRPTWAINFHEFNVHSNNEYGQNSIYVPIGNTVKKVIQLQEQTSEWSDINNGWRGEPKTDKDIKVTYKLIEPREDNYSGLKDILAHRTGLDYNEKTKKSFKVNQKILYQFDFEKEEYVVKK